MSTLDTGARVRTLLAEQLGLEAADVLKHDDDVVIQQEFGTDSLDDVELIMALEDEFNLNIADEIACRIKTIGDAVAVANGTFA